VNLQVKRPRAGWFSDSELTEAMEKIATYYSLVGFAL
jgi:hypothetical protein